MPKEELFTDHFSTSSMGKHTAVLKVSAEREQKLYDEIVKQRYAKQQKLYDELLSLNEKYDSLLLKQELGTLSEKEAAELASLKDTYEARKQKEKEYAQVLAEARKEAVDAATTYEINSYKRMSADKRREYSNTVYTSMKQEEDRRNQELAKELEHAKELEKQREKIRKSGGEGTDEDKELEAKLKEANEKIKSLEEDQAKQDAALDSAKRFSKSEELLSLADPDSVDKIRDKKREVNTEKISNAYSKKQAAQDKLQAARDELQEKWAKENAERAKKIEKARRENNETELKALEQEEELERRNFEKANGLAQLQEEVRNADEELLKAQKEAAEDELKGAGKKAVSKVLEETVDNISGNLDALYGQQGRMMGRLQSSGTNWVRSVEDVSSRVGVSGIVSQKNVVAKMIELVDSGVAYNLEMRAFLAETSQNIASTFDAANGTLLRMIRLQQSDTTAARLGMEAALTRLFNKYFTDSAYLTGPSDAVSAAIMDASATMDKNKSLEFEFTVQKWLGSLYSLGMSEAAVQQIAEGINYLGTGNVSALSNNSPLQTLFAMSASRAGGKSYAQMLTTGLTAEDTNNLLKAMIKYLAEIAESQNNYVTKAAYADLFGMSLTDLTTFNSLTTKEIDNIHKQSTSYNKLMLETEGQLLQTLTRVNVSQLVDTAIENAEVGASQMIGSNPFSYGTWKALSLLKKYVGKVDIPGIIGMGTGIASGLDILNLAQTVMAGMGLIGSLIRGVGSMATGGVLNFNAWDYSEYTSRGSGLKLLDTGSLTTTSFSESIGVGGGSGSDIASASEESGKESAMESAGTTSAEMEEQKEAGTKIYDVLAGDTEPTVLSLLQEIDEKLDLGRVFYTAIVGQASSANLDNIVTLSSQVAAARMISEGSDESSGTTDNSGSTRASSTSTGISSKGSGAGSEESPDLSEIISAAVNESLRAVLSTYEMSGFPVTVRNGGF